MVIDPPFFEGPKVRESSIVLEEGGIRYSYRVLRRLLESEDARPTVPALSSSLTKQTESSKPVAASPKLRKKVGKCREERRRK